MEAMKHLALPVSITWLCLLSVSFVASAGTVKVETTTISTDVCSVLKNPRAFVNQVIRVRGFVYLGEDHMNIADRLCAGRGIELMIKTEAVMKHKDIHHFYVQMNRQGRHGIATITGLFQLDPDPVTPYVLNIQHVKDVVPSH
ncbi:hypothetical protein [Luteibacter sp. dw_328]|uniref:hypothetical protein n=1 Tax=Luteibacter sp. dw_328 TaxID=2719796 RepID=UPI001BD26FF4|nr:hypothetical protein [Luteibacter sp. dw_328]